MNKSEDNLGAIDAVVTWVDGDDPVHRRKRKAALNHELQRDDEPVAAGRHETRFKDNGELRYCLASIRRFAPWVRYIHLITDNQTPGFLTPELIEEYRIKYVDHQDIFQSFEWALPTFNSRSIETAMWRIPDLADRFLYLNDDFLIVRDVSPEDFFIDDKVLLRGEWRPLPRYGPTRLRFNQSINVIAYKLLRRTRTMHPLAQMRAARLAGFDKRYFHTPHLPHPVQTNTLASFFQDNPHAFTRNIGYRFRDTNQYWPISLAYHLELAGERAVLAGAGDATPINGERHSARAIRKKLDAVRAGKLRFLCLTALECTEPLVRQDIDTTLDSLLGS